MKLPTRAGIADHDDVFEDVGHASEALLTALQLHPAAAVTVTVPLTIVEATLADAGEIVGVQSAPACVTVNVLPAIVTVLVRGVVPALAATL